MFVWGSGGDRGVNKVDWADGDGGKQSVKGLEVVEGGSVGGGLESV